MNNTTKVDNNNINYGKLKSENQIIFLDKEINILGRGQSCDIKLNVFNY